MTEKYTKPDIKTALPGPKAQAIIATDKGAMTTSAAREYPFVIDHGVGSWLWDVDGNRFLDFMSGIAVSSTGHSHPEVIAAVKEQADKFFNMCGHVFYNPQQAEYAARLTKLAQIKGNGKNRVFFCNSGAEAWEGAIKLARYKTKRQNVICFYGAFHGRTMGAVSANASKVPQRRGFGAMSPGYYHAFYPKPYKCPHDAEIPTSVKGCIAYIKEHLFTKMVSPDEVAAIALEPIQGEGGYVVPPVEFLQEIRKICDEHGIMMVVDEVQSGMGRTGTLFAMDYFGVKPDIITAAKGIASGLPLGAFIANEAVMDWPEAAHGTTFGGNALAIAAASKTLDLLEGGLMDHAAKVGKAMLARLQNMVATHPIIGDVRGVGLMIGAEIVKDKDSGPQPFYEARNKILQECFKRGLLTLGCGTSTIRFCPPLVISEEEAMAGLDIFEEAVSTVEAGL